jgi:hypothetical protein
VFFRATLRFSNDLPNVELLTPWLASSGALA